MVLRCGFFVGGGCPDVPAYVLAWVGGQRSGGWSWRVETSPRGPETSGPRLALADWTNCTGTGNLLTLYPTPFQPSKEYP